MPPVLVGAGFRPARKAIPMLLARRLPGCGRGWTCLLFVAVSSAHAKDMVTFADHALPVLRQRCGSCHNPDKKTAGLDVTSYAAIMRGGGSGEVIAAGDAAGSYLFRVANHDDEPKMPPDSPPIPEAERAVLRAWIDGGVLETKGSVAVAAKKVEVAMAAPVGERPTVPPLPGRLPLEPAVRAAAPDACASLATSPWAPLAVACGQKQLLLYRTDTLDLAGVLPFPEGRPHVVRFSGGGGLVIAGGGVGEQSGRVAVWDVKTGRRLRTVGDELDAVLAADISPDQRLVALGGPQKVARIWSVETGEKLHDLGRHTDWIQAVAFSPDGALLATADRAGNVFLWEAATGRDYLAIPAHPAAVTSLAWRGDSNLLASGCEDGQIRLWEPENGTLVKAFPAHAGGVAAVDFLRDGRIASVGRDKTPKLWKADFSPERSFDACDDIGLAVAACDETGRLIVGDWTGELRVFNLGDAARTGTLDMNPPPLDDRVTATERALADAKAKLDEAVAAAATAADSDKPAAEALVIDLKNDVARAAAAQARWLGEVAFQANYDRLAKTVADRQAAVQAAESDWGTVEAQRRANEQALQAAATKRDDLRKQAEALAAAIAQAEQQLKDLTAQLDKQKAEMAGFQNGLPAATTAADTAAAAATAAAKAAEEKKSVIAARQAEVDAAAKALEALQSGPR